MDIRVANQLDIQKKTVTEDGLKKDHQKIPAGKLSE
jgi:hypothetical protein